MGGEGGVRWWDRGGRGKVVGSGRGRADLVVWLDVELDFFAREGADSGVWGKLRGMLGGAGEGYLMFMLADVRPGEVVMFGSG